MNTHSILLVEDELSMRLGMQQTLLKAGYVVSTAGTAEEAQSMLEGSSVDLLITDFRLPGMDGMRFTAFLKEFHPHIGVILITAFPEVELAVQAIKAGAFDFLCKPFQKDGLLIAVERFFKFYDLSKENARLREVRGFIGESPSMLRVFERVAAIADACVPVLVRGPSGSGKELVAAALHERSSRHTKPFIKINCAAMPEQLLESELFGHEKGAFTGALAARKGKFDAANGGTLFFDELGEMPLPLQAKFLRVLEDQEITPVGGNVAHKVQVRTVFATACDLEQAVAEGRFREDLYYRINIVPINLPALKERREDITLLAVHFLHNFCAVHGRNLVFSDEAAKTLESYDYPGNVRELRNAVERAVLLATGNTIAVAHLPPRMREHAQEQRQEELQAVEFAPEDNSLAAGLARYEKECITQALASTGGKKQQAAAALGITRKQLWLKMKVHKLEA